MNTGIKNVPAYTCTTYLQFQQMSVEKKSDFEVEQMISFQTFFFSFCCDILLEMLTKCVLKDIDHMWIYRAKRQTLSFQATPTRMCETC